MYRALLLGLALVIPWPLAHAGDAPKKEGADAKSPAAAAQLETLKTEFKTAAQSLSKEFGQAATEEDKEKVKDRYFELLAQFADKLQRFAAEHAQNPAGKEARQGATQVLQELTRSGSPAVAQTLRLLMEKATDVELRGQASFVLARNLIKQYEQAYQKKNKGAAQLAAEAETLLKQVADKYGDVAMLRGKLADQVADVLFELKHLSVGKPAQEIEGEDIDGKTFKLSDYRGKVVVLDFWGHW